MASIDPKVSAAFDLMLGGVENITRKGVTFPYAIVNGNMFATISKQNTIGIMVDEDEWRSFEGAGGMPFEAVPGIPLKGFGMIPETMYKDRLQLQSWFRRAHATAEKLPAKVIEMPKKDVSPVITPAGAPTTSPPTADAFPKLPVEEPSASIVGTPANDAN